MALAGIIMLLKSFAVIDVSSVMIFSILFIIYGFASVYISLARHLRGRLFMGTVLFLFGIILFVVHYYEFPGIGIIIFPSILFMLGAGFMMLYIDEAENRVFLIASAILIISSLIYIFFARHFAFFQFTYLISELVLDFYPVFIILLGISLLVRTRQAGR